MAIDGSLRRQVISSLGINYNYLYVSFFFPALASQWKRSTVVEVASRGNTPQTYGLVQERRNYMANALELRLSCTNPTKWAMWYQINNLTDVWEDLSTTNHAERNLTKQGLS